MLSTTATAAAAAAATDAPELPLKGLLVLNSLHFAPKTIIILETAILGFLAAIRGLEEKWTRVRSYIKRKEKNKQEEILEGISPPSAPKTPDIPDKLAEGLVVGEGPVVFL